MEQTVELTEVAMNSVYQLYHNYVNLVCRYQNEQNDLHRVGGPGRQVEADEIALRALHSVSPDGEPITTWVRLFGLCQRGSTRMVLIPLPDRETRGAGQGGGGALSIEELATVLEVGSDNPRLVPQSILHTDSAKAYRHVGPLRYPPAGALHDAFEHASPFARHRYCHTNVTHKRKIGESLNFVKNFVVKPFDGEERAVLGGTQRVDGYWSSLRRCVGKRSLNTGVTGSARRDWLIAVIRCHQWEYWNLDVCRFKLLGEVLQKWRG